MFARKLLTTPASRRGLSFFLTQPLRVASLMTVANVRSVLPVASSLVSTRQARPFSQDSTVDSDLSQILTEEILEETSRKDEETDEDYEDVKKYITSIFELSEQTGYGEVSLSRTLNEEKITVKFDCQDEADADDEQENLDDENFEGEHHVQEEDPEKLDGKFGIHFEVNVEKKHGTAVFSCIATHQQPKIVHVTFLPAGIPTSDTTVYGGPRFEDLDPAVQGGFQQYLAERGIDEDFSFFVIQHARYKEEGEYLNWLKTLNDFVN